MSNLRTLKEAATQIYQDAVYRAPAGAQRQDIFEEVSAELFQQYARGQIELDVETAIRDQLKSVDSEQQGHSDSMIAALRDGTLACFGPDSHVLRTVVVLGKGWRKSWEHVTFKDLADMEVLRRQNMQNVVSAYEEWQENFAAIAPAVERYGTIGAAVRAGAFGQVKAA